MSALPVNDLDTWARELIAALDVAARKADGSPYSDSTIKSKMDVVVNARGGRVRLGASNSKTDAPGTYRGVGFTCTLDCGHHPANDGSCFADKGPVGIQTAASRGPWEQAANAFAMALVWAGVKGESEEHLPYHKRQHCRIHVGGDFGVDDGDPMSSSPIDWNYVAACAALSRAACILYDRPTLAWGYTAFTGDEGALLVEIMRAAGTILRLSGYAGEGGALTLPFNAPLSRDLAADLCATDAGMFMCPAQLSKTTTCKSCGACFNTRLLDRAVVFDPHGAGASKYKPAVRSKE